MCINLLLEYVTYNFEKKKKKNIQTLTIKY